MDQNTDAGTDAETGGGSGPQVPNGAYEPGPFRPYGPDAPPPGPDSYARDPGHAPPQPPYVPHQSPYGTREPQQPAQPAQPPQPGQPPEPGQPPQLGQPGQPPQTLQPPPPLRPRDEAAAPDEPRGAPQHIGARPPRYKPTPLGLPSPGDSDQHAAALPDTILDGATCGPLTVRAASVRGDSHRHLNECRQDALALTRLGSAESGLLLLAVADGVGRAARSHTGSHTVVQGVAQRLDWVAEELATALSTGDGDTFQRLADEAVADTAELLRSRMKAPGPEYSTTLRALLVPLDPLVRTRGFLSVGDGGLFRLGSDGWRLLDEPAAGSVGGAGSDSDSGPGPGPGRDSGAATGVINTSTPALPDHYDRVATKILGASAPGDVLVLCTDGFSGPLEGELELRQRLAELWRGDDTPVPHLSDFLWQMQMRAKTYDDDRTVICLWEGVR